MRAQAAYSWSHKYGQATPQQRRRHYGPHILNKLTGPECVIKAKCLHLKNLVRAISLLNQFNYDIDLIFSFGLIQVYKLRCPLHFIP